MHLPVQKITPRNISADGAVKSAFKMVRAALFFSLFILSIFVIDVDPHELEQ